MWDPCISVLSIPDFYKYLFAACLASVALLRARTQELCRSVFIPHFSARRREMHNNFTPIDLHVYIHILASSLLASDFSPFHLAAALRWKHFSFKIQL